MRRRRRKCRRCGADVGSPDFSLCGSCCAGTANDKPGDKPPLTAVANVLAKSAGEPDPKLVDSYVRLIRGCDCSELMREINATIEADRLAFDTAKRFLGSR